MKTNKVEIFTAGCPLCDETVKTVKKIVKQNEIVVYNLKEKYDSDQLKKYGINTIPAVVVNGKLLNCCKSNKLDVNLLKSSLFI